MTQEQCLKIIQCKPSNLVSLDFRQYVELSFRHFHLTLICFLGFLNWE